MAAMRAERRRRQDFDRAAVGYAYGPMPRPIRAVVKASALRHNLQVAREAAGEAKIWAVVKANAYGHGLERAARALAAADGFALLDFQEAVRLRLAGVTKPILMLEGFFRPLDVNLLFKYRLTPVMVPPVPTPLTMISTSPLVSSHISGPVVCSCMAGLAGLSNWLGIKYLLGSLATMSFALAIAAGMPLAPSVKTTFAPKAFIIWRRSKLMVFGMVRVMG